MSERARFRVEDLEDVLRKRKIATMAELKGALGTRTDVTVFRKLKELGYRTSYSHRGQYYALKSTPRFDRFGLWSCDDVLFSRYGTLVNTAEAFVRRSDAGLFVDELESTLHVEVKGTLLKLLRAGRLDREQVAGRYLYCAGDVETKTKQLALRRAQEETPPWAGTLGKPKAGPDDLKAAIVLFFSLLDEKQRRLYAGLESLKWGHGGDRSVADFLGLDPTTVSRGRRQLLNRDVEVDRVRKAGGGRKALEKKRRRRSKRSSSS
jgi:hypothetical protein